MCEERETPLADLLAWAKKALTNPTLFCQFVEQTEHILRDLFNMSAHGMYKIYVVLIRFYETG